MTTAIIVVCICLTVLALILYFKTHKQTKEVQKEVEDYQYYLNKTQQANRLKEERDEEKPVSCPTSDDTDALNKLRNSSNV